MRNKVLQISEAEIEVMKTLWERGTMSAKEIIEEIEKTNDWKPKTIQTLITRLVAKGAVKTEKKDAKAFLYSATVKRGEYEQYANKNFIKKLYNGSLNLMLASFIKDEKLSKEDIEELKNILEDKQNES